MRSVGMTLARPLKGNHIVDSPKGRIDQKELKLGHTKSELGAQRPAKHSMCFVLNLNDDGQTVGLTLWLVAALPVLILCSKH